MINPAVYLALATLVALSTGCAGDGSSRQPTGSATLQAAATRKPVEARRVPITVRANGYEPSTIEARPGESLALVFTLSEDTECGRIVQVPSGSERTYLLPLNTPVTIPVTAPTMRELVFGCGEEPLQGRVVISTLNQRAALGWERRPGPGSTSLLGR
jgi:hypothetical protein